MIPKRFQPVVFAILLSGMMSFVVSGIATVRSIGFVPDVLLIWMNNWSMSWAVAAPTAYFLAPFVRRWSLKLTGQDA
ncbi:MAG: DUF2798 domain-containing protein [Pseudomonadota bacterium]